MSTEPSTIGQGLEAACPPKTRADLEWDRVLSAISERCHGEMGQADARELSFAATREEVRTRLAEAREAFTSLAAGEPCPSRPSHWA